jgi:hypothetical protein
MVPAVSVKGEDTITEYMADVELELIPFRSLKMVFVLIV